MKLLITFCLILISFTNFVDCQIAVKRHIEKSGFHRFLVTEVSFDFDNIEQFKSQRDNCKWLLVDNFTANVYLDYFELKNYEQLFLFSMSRRVNIEKAEYNSRDFELFIFPEGNAINYKSKNNQMHGEFTLKVPIHIRYHDPEEVEYINFTLNNPRLFLSNCNLKAEPLDFNLDLPCMTSSLPRDVFFNTAKKQNKFDGLNLKMCTWKEYAFTQLPDSTPIEITVPVGVIAHEQIVVNLTIGFLLLVTSLVLFSIRTKSQSRNKAKSS